MSTLSFDEPTHRYFLGDRELISVTQVIERAGLYEYSWSDDFARERGSAAHKAIHYALEGDLDEADASEMILGYVTAARNALRDLDIEVLASELRVWNPLMGYAGTIDVYGRYRRPGPRPIVIVDWKSSFTLPRATAIQLAGYGLATHADLPLPPAPLEQVERMAIGIHPDGEYRVFRYEDQSDYNVFRAALAIARWKEAAIRG